MKTLVAIVVSLGVLGGVAACSKGEGAAPAPAAAANAPAPAVKEWYCPMDQEVVSDKPGQTCPRCGMKLEPRPAK